MTYRLKESDKRMKEILDLKSKIETISETLDIKGAVSRHKDLCEMLDERAGVRTGDIVSDIEEMGTLTATDRIKDIKLKDAQYDSSSEELSIVLVESGADADMAERFKGVKIYLNVPTKAERWARPEGDCKNWVGTITEAHYEAGKIIGTIQVHDDWLKSRLSDPIARKGLSLFLVMGAGILHSPIFYKIG